MGSPLRLLLTTTMVATALGAVAVPGRASCAAPQVSAPRRVTLGETIRVVGEYWSPECNDTEVCTVGCTGESCEGGGPNRPAGNLRVVLASVSAQDDLQAELASDVAANRELEIDLDVTIPQDLAPGRYRILVGNERTGFYRTQTVRIVPAR
jgi:hypothetical protein